MASSTDIGNTKEIDIIAAAKKIWAHKLSLLIFIAIFSAIGIIVAINTPKKFTANVILAPEVQGSSVSGSLSDMASNFGIDLGDKQSVDAIYPEIYPLVVSSNDFILGLFDIPVHCKDSSDVKTYSEHLKKDLKIPFWEVWRMSAMNYLTKNKKNPNGKASVTDSDQFEMAKPVYAQCNMVRNSISCLVDKKTSIITISVTDQDPLVAAIVTDTIQHRLQSYINAYKTKKTRRDVDYYKKLRDESLNKYKKAQKEYADYADAHQDLMLQEYQSKEEDLENDMQLKYNTYTQMQAQYQNAQAKLQQSMPAYTVLQKPTMPYEASSSPRSLIFAVYLLIGIIFDSIFVLLVYPYIEKKIELIRAKKEDSSTEDAQTEESE